MSLNGGDFLRIELFSNGNGSVATFQKGVTNLHSDINATIDSLRGVQKKMNNITGGVGNLSGAVASIQSRITVEENKLAAVEQLSQKTSTFISNTITTDAQVANLVNQNQDKFFNAYTWLRPSVEEEKSWWEKFVDGWNNFWGDVGEAVKNVLYGIIEYVKEHAVEFIIGAVAIVVGAAIIALTGGAAAAFIPALLAGLKAAAISAIISGAISSFIALLDGGNVLEAFGDGLASGFKWGGILSLASSAIAGALKISSRCGLTETVIGKIKLWSPNSATNPNVGGTVFKFGKTFRIDFEVNTIDFTKTQFFHTHITKTAYENMPSIFKGMTWIFDPAKRDVHVRLIPIVAPMISNLFDRK